MFFTKKINNSNGRNYVIFRMDKKSKSISEIEFINNIFNKQKNDVIFSLKEVFSNEKNIFVTIEVLSYEKYDDYYHHLIQEYKNNNIYVEIFKIDNSNLIFENLNSLKTIFKK